MKIISQDNVIKANLDYIDKNDINSIDDVFRYGKDIMGVYYDLDGQPKMCLLAKYTNAELAIVAMEDYLDWRDNHSDKSETFQFLSEEESIKLGEIIMQEF